MPKFQVTFRLHDDTVYEQRRTSLLNAASFLAPLVWDEPTSLLKFECNGTHLGVRDFLLANSTVYRDGRDYLLVEEVTVHNYAAIGIKYEALYNVTTGTAPRPALALPQPTGLGIPFPSQDYPDLMSLRSLINNEFSRRQR